MEINTKFFLFFSHRNHKYGKSLVRSSVNQAHTQLMGSQFVFHVWQEFEVIKIGKQLPLLNAWKYAFAPMGVGTRFPNLYLSLCCYKYHFSIEKYIPLIFLVIKVHRIALRNGIHHSNKAWKRGRKMNSGIVL